MNNTSNRWVGRFADRVDAGRRLAARLSHLRGQDVVVLGLPRGGMPVAFEVARSLGAPLDVVVVRKLGIPGHREVAMGAIGEGGFRFIDRDRMDRVRVTDADLRVVEDRERAVLDARVARLRHGRDRVDLTGRTVVIVDDGVATGSTARVACEAARGLGAAWVVLAVPVGPPGMTREDLAADEYVCVSTPFPFLAVGYSYQNFVPTTDAEVEALLDAAARQAPAGHPTGLDLEVRIPVDDVVLEGRLRLPPRPRGVVVFAHGSGSSRHSPRNEYVAAVLHDAGLGILLMDLLTPAESQDRAKLFDIELLARRLSAAVRWVRGRPEVASSRIGLFGASTGASAALRTAADLEVGVAAVVSRGGRPDLAGEVLAQVEAPTLLIVGEQDPLVLRLNEQARARLHCASELAVVPGATHLFEEPGTLASVASLAKAWFQRHLQASGQGEPGTTAAAS